jgi:hypothetical protein
MPPRQTISDRRIPLDPWPGHQFEITDIIRDRVPQLCDLARCMYREARQIEPAIMDKLPVWDEISPAPLMARFGEYGGSWDDDEDERKLLVARELQRQMQREWKQKWREKNRCKPPRK